MNKKLKKRLIILGVTAVITAGSIIGAVQYMNYRNDQKTVEVQPMAYLTTGYWGSDTSTSGNIVSDYMQELFPDSSKSISEIFVEEGQSVAIGDPLLQYNREALELDVEAKTVAQQQVQVRIDEANRQLKKLQKTKAYVEPTPTPKPRVTPTPKPTKKPTPTPTPTPKPTPTPFPTPDVNIYSELTLDSVPYRGSGTSSDPYVFLCKDGYKLTPDFMKLMMGLLSTGEPTMSPEPTFTPEPTETPAPEPGPDETPTPEPTETPTPAPTESPTPPPFKLISPFAAVFEVREHDSNYGGLISKVTIDGTGFSGSVNLPGIIKGVAAATDVLTDAVNSPAQEKAAATPTPTPKPTPEPDNYNHMNYTKKELDELIKAKKREITNLQHDMKQAQLDLDKANRALENSTVLSTVDGQVRTLIDIDTATSEGRPFLVVSGAQQYYVSGTISESLLGSVNIGDQVTVNSWSNGMTYSAQIVSISDYPTEGNSWSSDTNPNNSFYEFTAVLMDADDTIQSGSWVEITLSVNDTSSMDALYLERMYIREDDSGYYVMKAGKNNRLMKSYVTVGKSLGSYALEIKSGATGEDFIAFPYGQDVKEGVRCVLQESGEPPFPEGSGEDESSSGLESLPDTSGGLADGDGTMDDGTGAADDTVDGDGATDDTGDSGDTGAALPDGGVITGRTEDGVTFETENGGGIILD